MEPSRKYIVYKQSFQSPLITSRGRWEERTSWVLREQKEDGSISFGEIAPIPDRNDIKTGEFQAELDNWASYQIDSSDFLWIRPALTSLASSIWMNPDSPRQYLKSSARLWGMKPDHLEGVVKRKIGILPPTDEIPMIQKWLKNLPEGVRVRLDPNESFSRDDLLKWTESLMHFTSVEFIEQPTGFKDDEWLLNYAPQSPIPIALDESLLRLDLDAQIAGLGKNIFFVIKPILFPDWISLFSVFKDCMDRVIFSTAFESPFGYEALLRLASHSPLVPGLERSCFLGNKHEFKQHHQANLSSPSVSVEELDRLWRKLDQ